MTAFDHVLASAHLIEVHADGDCYRAVCWCGWSSLARLTASEAATVPCGAETELREGRQRTAAFLARRQSAA